MEFIKAYASKIMVAVIVVLFSTLLGVGYLYKGQIEETAKLETEKQALIESVERITNQIEKEKIAAADAVRERNKIDQAFRKFKDDQIKNKRPITEVIADPESERRRVQDSYETFIDDIRCATGDIGKCY